MNGLTLRCMRPGVSGTGNIGVPEGCQNHLEWRWDKEAPQGDTFLIKNRRSGQCLGDQRRRGRARTVFCSDQSDLRFRFEEVGWADPVGEWVLEDCSGASQMTSELVTRIETSQSLTETTTVTVKASIEKGVIFGGAALETSISQSLAMSWASSVAQERRNRHSCNFWPGGEEVRCPNCLWFWKQTMRRPSADETIEWSATYGRCTEAGDQIP